MLNLQVGERIPWSFIKTLNIPKAQLTANKAIFAEYKTCDINGVKTKETDKRIRQTLSVI